MKIKFFGLALILLNFLIINLSHANSAMLCLSPIFPNVLTKIEPEKITKNPNFFVKVDNVNWQAITGIKQSIALNLSPKKQHFIVIKSGDKIVESFKFRFTDYHTNQLKLVYDASYYQSWKLVGIKNCH